MKCDKKIVQDPKRIRPAASEVLKLVSDNNKARNLLGWQPAVSNEEGLMRTIAFIRENIDFYRPSVYNI
jgi:nucleoside-diphosphate-sugar epimerase